MTEPSSQGSTGFVAKASFPIKIDISLKRTRRCKYCGASYDIDTETHDCDGIYTKEGLTAGGFSGLYCDGCSCEADDLYVCGGGDHARDCEPGVLVDVPPGYDVDVLVVPKDQVEVVKDKLIQWAIDRVQANGPYTGECAEWLNP